MSWQAELDELAKRKAFAERMGGEDKVKRQHDGGRLTVRERIAKLIDPGSFHETGALAERLEAVRSPFRTAERFGVEEIVDPRGMRAPPVTPATVAP